MEIQRDTQRERLFYIDFLAFFTGQVTRKDLVVRFGISEPAATKDLSLYAELAPNMLSYDLRQRCYVYGSGAPRFPIVLTKHYIRSAVKDRSLLILGTRNDCLVVCRFLSSAKFRLRLLRQSPVPCIVIRKLWLTICHSIAAKQSAHSHQWRLFMMACVGISAATTTITMSFVTITSRDSMQ